MKWKQYETCDLVASQPIAIRSSGSLITEKLSAMIIPVKVAAALSPESAYELLRRQEVVSNHYQIRSEVRLKDGAQFEVSELILIFDEGPCDGGVMQEEKESAEVSPILEGDNGSVWRITRKTETALLRVPLSIVLGTAEIPALRLFEMSRGDLIDFEIIASSQVKLMLAGRTMAVGRLVKEGERVAVEIISTSEAAC